MKRAIAETSVDDTIELAKAIVAMRPSQVVLTIQDMMFKRELSQTVSALNTLVLDNPAHKQVAAQALAKMGLWLDAS
ncbi:MAG TPA: hypothetical protein VH933_07000 [Aestuariivirgaceae bacterium]|jgi:hypothetical protein